MRRLLRRWPRLATLLYAAACFVLACAIILAAWVMLLALGSQA